MPDEIESFKAQVEDLTRKLKEAEGKECGHEYEKSPEPNILHCKKCGRNIDEFPEKIIPHTDPCTWEDCPICDKPSQEEQDKT